MTTLAPAHRPGVRLSALAKPLCDVLVDSAAALRLAVERSASGATIIDAGIAAPGGLEAGRRIAELCMGGLGSVRFQDAGGPWPVTVFVHSAQPVLACLASQYAGLSLSHGEGKGKFQALASGPGRAAVAREKLYEELGYDDRGAAHCALVLEVDKRPPEEIVQKVARDANLAPEAIALVLTPTKSLAGTVQVVARVLEVALHKAHALGFPLDAIIDGAGSAPLPPPGKDFLASMGRTNDAILFGGRVQLFVAADDDRAAALARNLPASASRDYGRPFAEVFKAFEYDFYRIDPMLFAPAEVVVTAVPSGRSFRSGRVDPALIERSFLG
ncbi:MAG: methenyltetrahydromethanopterin cyclohydrolase [Burkholderiales bacterium]